MLWVVNEDSGADTNANAHTRRATGEPVCSSTGAAIA